MRFDSLSIALGLTLGCLFFGHSVSFAKRTSTVCEWTLSQPPSATREFLRAAGVDLTIPHRRVQYEDLTTLYGATYRQTDHGNFLDFKKAYGTVRVDRSAYAHGDGSLESRLLERSEVDLNPIEMNSLRAIKLTKDGSKTEAVDSNRFIRGIQIPGGGMAVPSKELYKEIGTFITGLLASAPESRFVGLQILHVHPLYELIFNDAADSFASFPPSLSDIEFATHVSRSQPGILVFFKVLVPNGFDYTVALFNGENVTEKVLNHPHPGDKK